MPLPLPFCEIWLQWIKPNIDHMAAVRTLIGMTRRLKLGGFRLFKSVSISKDYKKNVFNLQRDSNVKSMVRVTWVGYYFSWLRVYVRPVAMQTNLFSWHWIWSVSVKNRNTNRKEAFQLARVTTAIPKRLTLILPSEMTLTAQNDSINVFFNLDYYL